MEQKEKKPGIKEVAKEAGVSPTTVSRVLNNRGYISKETKDKVYQAMDRIGYYPNEIARALLNNRTYFIGVIMPSVTSPFHGEVVYHLEHFLSDRGYKMLLCNSNNKVDTELEYVSMLRRNQVDGIIVGTHNQLMEEYKDINMPVVTIDRNLGDDIPVVASDNYRIGELATNHLLEKGCKHILCIRGDSRLKMPGNNRSAAYLDVMKQHGYETMVLEAPFVLPLVEKQKRIYEILNEHPEIDGIFAGDDLLAVCALHVAREKQIRVPEDLKIIGVDGTRQTLEYIPELTTIRQSSEEIARIAVEKMIQQIEGQKTESKIDLPVTLLMGKTT